jgi:hypothetical protein
MKWSLPADKDLSLSKKDADMFYLTFYRRLFKRFGIFIFGPAFVEAEFFVWNQTLV